MEWLPRLESRRKISCHSNNQVVVVTKGVEMKQESEQFKIEATPVIDLKKSPVTDLWDNEKTEVYLEDEAGGTAYLLTAEGDYIPISAFPFVVGRGNECDLVLNKKGMSRKHAEIVFQSGRFVINDLDSLNGLKVNGYKVARVILEEGDSIKLGEVTLIFTSSKNAVDSKLGDGEISSASSLAGASVKNPGKKGKSLLYVVASLAVLIIAGAGVYLVSGKSLLNKANQQVVSVPNPGAASSVREKTDEAAPNSGVAESGPTQGSADVSASQESQVQDATLVDPTAPPPSIAFSSGAQGPIAPPPPVEDKKPALPKTMAKAEPVKKPATASAAPAVKTVVKPSVTPRIDSPPFSASVASAVGNVDARYLSGDIDGLLKEMGQALKSSRAGDAAYRNKYNAYASMYGKYTAGKQAYIEGRTAEAFSQWSSFLAEEKAMFGGKRSTMANATVSKMADGYAALGNESAKAGRNHEAYKYWQKSVSYGDSVAARIALDAANQKSKQLYRQALRLEYVNSERAKQLWKQVMDIVPPGTEYYTKASSKLAWYEKWGA